MVDKPKPGSIWQHANGCQYFVLTTSNTATVRENHPPDVVYLSYADGQKDYYKVWTRPLTTWHEKMAEVKQ